LAGHDALRPNLLFILSDDQGPWALGCAGNDEIHTPHLDRLAASGVRLSRFFAASPVCSPSRASLFTGQIPSRHGVHDWISSDNDPQELPYILHVRCDWMNLDESTPEEEAARAMAAANPPTGHKGACITELAKRIFIMKESRDNPNFGEVIKHIKEARNQSSFPPLRDGENYGNPLSPPLKGPRGTEKPKVIRGDWLAPRETESPSPLSKKIMGFCTRE
jgi:hypothetical protein